MGDSRVTARELGRNALRLHRDLTRTSGRGTDTMSRHCTLLDQSVQADFTGNRKVYPPNGGAGGITVTAGAARWENIIVAETTQSIKG